MLMQTNYVSATLDKYTPVVVAVVVGYKLRFQKSLYVMHFNQSSVHFLVIPVGLVELLKQNT